MKTRDGHDLVIVGGIFVTRTLPFGTPEDVKREVKWLVEKGPKTGLRPFLLFPDMETRWLQICSALNWPYEPAKISAEIKHETKR